MMRKQRAQHGARTKVLVPFTHTRAVLFSSQFTMNLSMDECLRVNGDLLKAVKKDDFGGLKNILITLKSAKARGNLKVCTLSRAFFNRPTAHAPRRIFTSPALRRAEH